MIKMGDALSLVEKQRGDAIMLSTMTGGGAWSGVSNNVKLDLPVSGAMGKASSIALGLALAQPDRKVMVVDGDGSLLMNLGSLVTIGGKMPSNLVHFVIDNGVYGVTGGQPTPNAENYNFAEIAKGSGYSASYEFDDLEDFATSIDEIMNTSGPIMVALKSVPEIDPVPINERPPTRRLPAAIKELAAELK